MALCGAGLALAWQTFLVYGLYGGDWSGLFYTGSEVALPPAIAAEDPARAPDAVGFDGQFYHVVAHAPTPPADSAAYVDNPGLRWRRILVPGLAHALAFGRDSGVDSAYLAVVLAFTAAGVWWAAELAVRHGASAWLGLVFLLAPATFISLERMAVDVALAALCVGFAVRVQQDKEIPFYAVLTLAPLARETGIALAGAWLLAQRSGRAALLAAASLAPLAAWSLYLHSRTPADATAWFTGLPFAGLVLRTLEPMPEAAPTWGLQLASGLDYLALLGVWAAIVRTALELRRAPRQPLALAAALTLAIFAFLAKEDIWLHAYGFARTLSPALLLLALLGLERRRAALALPLALTVPRMLYQALLLAKSARF